MSEASNVNRFISLTATRKFLMFSKYWIADCAAPSEDCTASMGFSTTCRNNSKQALSSQVPSLISEIQMVMVCVSGMYLGDGAWVDAVEDLAEYEAVTQGRAELLLGGPLRQGLDGGGRHLPQPSRRLAPPRGCVSGNKSGVRLVTDFASHHTDMI